MSLATDWAEARRRNIDTAFICHSAQDEVLIAGLQVLFVEHGLKVHLDVRHAGFSAQATQTQAALMQESLGHHQWFVFLATPASMASRWCVWQLGLVWGTLLTSRILVVETSDDRGQYGAVYRRLYRTVRQLPTGEIVWFKPDATEPTAPIAEFQQFSWSGKA